ncbi:hypothetical protein BDW59DRAFT_166913 [Aspergillus cavernicola]|uniref:Uncharacterized protein n=1 Tax=Aspergillus cavernicola TaxID=176166 RepID=A0ABR4HHT4_9EURO
MPCGKLICRVSHFGLLGVPSGFCNAHPSQSSLTQTVMTGNSQGRLEALPHGEDADDDDVYRLKGEDEEENAQPQLQRQPSRKQQGARTAPLQERPNRRRSRNLVADKDNQPNAMQPYEGKASQQLAHSYMRGTGQIQSQEEQQLQPKAKDEDTGLKLRLDLNLDIEVELKASIHGDLTLALL